MRKSIRKAMIQTGKKARSVVRERMSKKALSDEKLQAMDHPFARRHGSIKGAPYGSPAVQYVGRGSGALLKTLKGRTGKKNGQVAYMLRVGEGVRHAGFIFVGTRVMLPRNPMLSLYDEQVHRQLVQTFIANYN